MTGCAWCLHHEYTHIVHLEKSRGWIGGLRRVFGRVPLLLPERLSPAVAGRGHRNVRGERGHREGAGAGGRLPHDSQSGRGAGRFAPLDRAGGGVIDWPSGNAPYVYGAYFHQYLAERYGSESLERLAEATAGTLPFFGSRAFRTVFGRSLGRSGTISSPTRTADSLVRHLRTPSTRRVSPLTASSVTAPAFSRGRTDFLFLVNPHDFPALMELRRARRSRDRSPRGISASGSLSPATGWCSVSRSVVRHSDLQSDLYAVPDRRWCHSPADSRGSRDGCGCRARWPHDRLHRAADRPPDSCHFRHAAAGADRGCRRHSYLRTSTEFSSPRWSPDGRVIAAERRRLGGPSDIVLVDVATRSVRTLVTSEQGRNFGPMWLPDGATILFSSDRGGTPFGIYGADVATGAVRRLLGTGPGAQFPALSPDGRRLVFVGYTADGYDLYSMPFDAPQWADISGSAPNSRASRRNRSIVLQPAAPGDAPYRPGRRSRRDIGFRSSSPARRCPDWREHERVRCARPPRLRRDRNLGGSTKRPQLAVRLLVCAVVARRCSPAHPTPPTYWRSGDVRSREVTAGVLLPVRRVRWTTEALAAVQVIA